MTIKTRNRISIIFTTASIFIFLIEFLVFGYMFFSKEFTYPEVLFDNPLPDILFHRYSRVYVFTGLLIGCLYTIFTSLYIWLGFEKTQSAEVSYFMLFLLSFIFDSTRIYIPFFYTKGPYSTLIFTIGNLITYARILAPLSLVSLCVFVEDEDRQNTERNLISIILCAAFFTAAIPLNSSIVYPNFSIYYSYYSTILTTSIIITVMTTLVLLFKQYKNESKQFITIGYAMMSFGYLFIWNSINLTYLLTGTILLIPGTILYLGALHKRYMFDM